MALVVDSDIAEIADRLGDVADTFAGKKMVLAGGGGFLGRYFRATIGHLNRHRFSEPCELVVIDNLITTSSDEVIDDDHCRFLKTDVADPIEIDGPSTSSLMRRESRALSITARIHWRP